MNTSLVFRIHALEIIFCSNEHMIPPFQNLYVKNPNCWYDDMGDMAFERWLAKLDEQRTRRPVSNKINKELTLLPSFQLGLKA